MTHDYVRYGTTRLFAKDPDDHPAGAPVSAPIVSSAVISPSE